MGTGPIPASRLALKQAGWKAEDLDLIEANEAFAAQACAVNRDSAAITDIVNVNGGAIAIGHPIGASGGRVLATLLHEMARRKAKKGLATLCIGGGMGIAMCVARALSGKGGWTMARIAIVTGGTRGIGAAISKALKAEGHKVDRQLCRQ